MAYSIKLPSFYNDGKSMKLIMMQLNECFLEYKNEFNLMPDIIIFCGKNGKILHEILKDIFSGAYIVKYEDKGFDCVTFKSGKIDSKKIITEKGTPRGNSSISGMVVPGFCAPNIGEFLSFSYTEERDTETKMDFDINIFE